MQSQHRTHFGLVPDFVLPRVVQVPVSKSIAQRALMAASLAPGETHLLGLSQGSLCADIQAALEVSRLLGGKHRWLGAHSLVLCGSALSSPTSLRLRPPGSLETGESGTLARIVTAIAGLVCKAEVRIGVSGSLRQRSSPALFESLLAAGVEFQRPGDTGAQGWPVSVFGANPPASICLCQPSSSQEVSALLLAAAAHPQAIELHVDGVIPSRAYIELTFEVLRAFHVEVISIHPHFDGGESFCVRGSLAPPNEAFFVEPDASSAAVVLAAGAIRGSEVWVAGDLTQSHQADVAVIRHLAAFGITAGLDETGIFCRGKVQTGAELDLERTPDLAPPLVAVAAAAALRLGATSRFTGLKTLPYKECNRLEVLANGLQKLGLEVAKDGERGIMMVGPGTALPARKCQLDPHGDHRMAFAFALLGLVQPGITVATPGVVAKSWPSFWNDLAPPGLSSRA